MMPGSGSKMNTTGAVLEPIHRGWLTKSPPEPKFMSPWRFLVRAKWRRRYFVLHKPPGSLPDHFALDYFEDESLNKRLGTIDLELTEEIVSPLNSSQYDYLFLIKTKFKRKDRRYFLAVDTEDEMNKWIDCLCQVCGLKEQDEAADPASLVPPTEDAPHVSRHSLTGTNNLLPDTNLAVQSSIGGSYVKLDMCFSKPGLSKPDDQDGDGSDTLSIPDIPPPPVPNEDYDIPPRRQSYTESLYKVPPRREDVYDVPPSSECGNAENPNDFYDIPPPPVRADNNMPDSVPTRHHRKPLELLADRQEMQYINIRARTTDSAPPPPPRPSITQDSFYDVPPHNSLLSISPPAPGMVGPGLTHSYVNTEGATTYTHPNRDRDSDNSTYDILYTRSPEKPPPVAARRRSDSDDVYQVPPSNKPVNQQPPPTPARPENTLTKYSKPIDQQTTCEVFSTSRTTSFRRAGAKMTPSPVPRNRQVHGGASNEFSLGVPVRTGSSCSSSEDDDSTDRPHMNQAGPAPPRRKPPEAELQYLDLDLASRNAKVENRVPKPAQPGNSATEYKEIDFAKTNALSKAKKAMENEKERKNSDAGFHPH